MSKISIIALFIIFNANAGSADSLPDLNCTGQIPFKNINPYANSNSTLPPENSTLNWKLNIQTLQSCEETALIPGLRAKNRCIKQTVAKLSIGNSPAINSGNLTYSEKHGDLTIAFPRKSTPEFGSTSDILQRQIPGHGTILYRWSISSPTLRLTLYSFNPPGTTKLKPYSILLDFNDRIEPSKQTVLTCSPM